MSDAREALVALILERFRAAETYMDLPRQARLLADAIQSAGWIPPTVKPSVEALSDALEGEGIAPLPGERDLTLTAERLLALFHGRTETEVKDEAWDEVADYLDRTNAPSLAEAARRDNPYREEADRGR